MPLADINPSDKWVTDNQGNIIGVDSGSSTGPQYFGGVRLTQAAYDALAVKDPNTIYVIVG